MIQIERFLPDEKPKIDIRSFIPELKNTPLTERPEVATSAVTASSEIPKTGGVLLFDGLEFFDKDGKLKVCITIH